MCVQANDSFYFRIESRSALFAHNFIVTADSARNRKQIAKLSTLAYFERKCFNRDSLLVNNPYLTRIKNASLSFLGFAPSGLTGRFGFVTVEVCGLVTVANPTYDNGDPVGGWGYHEEWQCSSYTYYGYMEDTEDAGGGSGTSGTNDDWWNGYSSGGGRGGGSGSNNFDFKTVYDNYSGDEDNNVLGEHDTTSYDEFEPTVQAWPSISSILPISDFVGWGYPGIDRNCMDYAKAQILKKGYRISNYWVQGQTIQVYTAANGVNLPQTKNGVGYLLSALQRGIPVIVGVDDKLGSSNPDTDKTTDHFVVIVGSGTDALGNYFIFFDNASGNPAQGASPNNRLYYDSVTGLIKGRSQTDYAISLNDYIVTMIRKSK